MNIKIQPLSNADPDLLNPCKIIGRRVIPRAAIKWNSWNGQHCLKLILEKWNPIANNISHNGYFWREAVTDIVKRNMEEVCTECTVVWSIEFFLEKGGLCVWDKSGEERGRGREECLQSVSHSSPLQDIMFIYFFHWRKWGQRWWQL